ncbi:MAG: BrnT family toxin [Desulfoferrobacter sp.]
MEIQDIIWLDVFVEKLWHKHRVTTGEVEEMLFNVPKVRFIEKGDVKEEDVYAAMGRSHAGRYLITFFIRKEHNRALIISARDMSKNERKFYEKR